MNLYHVLELVGEGSFGRVHKGRKKFSGQVVALKFMPKVGRSEKELRNLKREIEIMRGLQHPNIVQLFDSFETDTEVVVVTEYAEGQLFQILEDDGGLPESHVRDIACQLVSALFYLHSHRILHRDMKPQNILLGKNGEVKLCDFGFARAMSVSTLVLTSIKGTPLYMSPELVEEKPYDHTADLWSLGCILYELHTGAPPFYTNSIFHLVQMIVRNPVKWPQTMSENCTSFLKGLLTKDPQRRLSWPHLLHHPFVEDGIQVLSDSTVCSPLTEAQSPDVMALKLQQVASKSPQVAGKSRMLLKVKEKSTKKTTKGLGCLDSERNQSKAASSQPSHTKLLLQKDVLQNSSLKSNSSCNQTSKHRSQISKDYAREFPSVEVGPLLLRRCFEERRPSLPEEKIGTDEYWENLHQEVGQNGIKVLKNKDFIPRLKSTFLALKTQVTNGTVKEPLEIHQTLNFLSKVICSLDQEESHDLYLLIGLPSLLFDLICVLVDNPNTTTLPWYVPTLSKMMELLLICWSRHCEWDEQAYSQLEEHSKVYLTILKQPMSIALAPLAAALLSMLVQYNVCVHCDLDTLVTLLQDLWKIDENYNPLPAGWGVFDGILALLLHTLSEHEGGPGSSRLDRDLFLNLWKRVGVSLGRTPPSTDQYSSSGLYSFLSLALLVFTQDPNSCIPLFSETSSKCIYTLSLLLKPDSLALFVEDSPHRLETDWTLDSLSMLSCHLLCFPFALDVPALTMSRLLDLYVSCNIVAGLLQMIQTQTPPLLELPLSLLSRLLLCDPQRSLSCLGDGASDFLMPCRDSHLTVPTSTPRRTAMSLLSELMQSDFLWEAAVELLTVLSQVAWWSPQFHLEVSVLQRALTHSHEQIRAATCRLMANMQPFKHSTLPTACDIFHLLVTCLSDRSMPVRRMACRAVGSWLGGLAEAGYKCNTAKSNQQGDGAGAVKGGVEKWTEAVKCSTAGLTSALTDPDTVTRRHGCAALGNLVKLHGAVEWVLEKDVSSSLLRTACLDSQHTVRHAAITALCVFCQQEPIRQVLISIDAKRKLLQASRAFPQSDYKQLIGQL